MKRIFTRGPAYLFLVLLLFSNTASALENSLITNQIDDLNTLEENPNLNMQPLIIIEDSGINWDDSSSLESIYFGLNNGQSFEILLPVTGQTFLFSSTLSVSTGACDLEITVGNYRQYVLEESTGTSKGSLSIMENNGVYEFDLYLVGHIAISNQEAFQIHANNTTTYGSHYSNIGYSPSYSNGWTYGLGEKTLMYNQGTTNQFSYNFYRLGAFYEHEDPWLICTEVGKADVLTRWNLNTTIVLTQIVHVQNILSIYPTLDCDNSEQYTVVPRSPSPSTNNPYWQYFDVQGFFFNRLDATVTVSYDDLIIDINENIRLGCGYSRSATATSTEISSFWVASDVYRELMNVPNNEMLGWHAQVLTHELMHTMGFSHSNGIYGGKNVTGGPICPEGQVIDSGAEMGDPHAEEYFDYKYSSLMAGSVSSYNCWGNIPWVASPPASFTNPIAFSIHYADQTQGINNGLLVSNVGASDITLPTPIIITSDLFSNTQGIGSHKIGLIAFSSIFGTDGDLTMTLIQTDTLTGTSQSYMNYTGSASFNLYSCCGVTVYPANQNVIFYYSPIAPDFNHWLNQLNNAEVPVYYGLLPTSNIGIAPTYSSSTLQFFQPQSVHSNSVFDLTGGVYVDV